jgi:hypothetical protein
MEFQFKAKGVILTAALARLQPESENVQQNQAQGDAKQAEKPELPVLVLENLGHQLTPAPWRDQGQQAFDEQHPAQPLQQVFKVHVVVTSHPSRACP